MKTEKVKSKKWEMNEVAKRVSFKFSELVNYKFTYFLKMKMIYLNVWW